MSLINRKPRPIQRGEGYLRDDRLFIVACDDTYAPKQYFDFFKIPRVQVHVIPTEDNTSSAPYVLDRLINTEHEEDDELWMLLDTDHCDKKTHIKTFNEALKKAKLHGISVALSKPCFELWLLLHLDEGDKKVASLKNAKETEAVLRQLLGEYNKSKLKQKHYPLPSVVSAYNRAKRLDASVMGGNIPQENTTRVYLLWKTIISSVASHQLPPELRNMLNQ